MTMQHADILIIGGGAIGSAAAYFLRRRPDAPGVLVVEPDPTYALASTPRATGGVRRLFSCPENIRMSQASMEFFARFAEYTAVAGEAPDLGWKPGGYLFVVDERAAAIVERNAATQRRLGVEVQLLDRAALAARFPSIRSDDLTSPPTHQATAGSTPTRCCKACVGKRNTSGPGMCRTGSPAWSATAIA